MQCKTRQICIGVAGNAEEWGAARAAMRSNEVRVSLDHTASLSSNGDGGGSSIEAATVLYDQGKASDCFTIILQGKALIRTGAAQWLLYSQE